MTEPFLTDGEDARGGKERFAHDLLTVYLPAMIGFLVINITNTTLLGSLKKHGLIYGGDGDPAVNELKTIQYFLVPLKALLFAVSTATLGLRLWPPVKRLVRLLTKNDIVQTLVAMAAGLVLTPTIFPLGFGRAYARISTDPFNQVPDQLYRRLLIPGLAYVWHLNGFLYIVMVWTILLAAVLAAKLFLASHGHRLSLLEEVSLLTVGVFITSFQVPGNPEAAVVLLALIALMNFEFTRQFSGVQLAALCLALMAHETCAFLVFAPMILFLFPRKGWVPCLTAGLIYGVTVMANFSFDPSIPIRIQSSVSDVPASFYFLRSPGIDLAAVFFAYKLLWIFVPVAVFYQFREDRRVALFCITAFALAIASMYVAVDYTRLIGFATIAILFCFAEAAKRLSKRALITVVTLNLLVPTIFVSGPSRLTAFQGLYGAGARWLIGLIGPRI